MLRLAWIHAITTPKSCQDRKVAAIRDACDRRDLRAAFFAVSIALLTTESRLGYLGWAVQPFVSYAGDESLSGVVLHMPGFGDLVQKAFYLGVGVASYAGEKAGGALGELRSQAQKLADEMVARGEMTTEEAKRLVDEMVNRAQQANPESAPTSTDRPAEPRRIEILSDDEPTPQQPEAADDLRQQVIKLQEELRRLQDP